VWAGSVLNQSRWPYRLAFSVASSLFFSSSVSARVSGRPLSFAVLSASLFRTARASGQMFAPLEGTYNHKSDFDVRSAGHVLRRQVDSEPRTERCLKDRSFLPVYICH
jgi:hypothetical protein